MSEKREKSEKKVTCPICHEKTLVVTEREDCTVEGICENESCGYEFLVPLHQYLHMIRKPSRLKTEALRDMPVGRNFRCHKCGQRTLHRLITGWKGDVFYIRDCKSCGFRDEYEVDVMGRLHPVVIADLKLPKDDDDEHLYLSS